MTNTNAAAPWLESLDLNDILEEHKIKKQAYDDGTNSDYPYGYIQWKKNQGNGIITVILIDNEFNNVLYSNFNEDGIDDDKGDEKYTLRFIIRSLLKNAIVKELIFLDFSAGIDAIEYIQEILKIEDNGRLCILLDVYGPGEIVDDIPDDETMGVKYAYFFRKEYNNLPIENCAYLSKEHSDTLREEYKFTYIKKTVDREPKAYTRQEKDLNTFIECCSNPYKSVYFDKRKDNLFLKLGEDLGESVHNNFKDKYNAHDIIECIADEKTAIVRQRILEELEGLDIGDTSKFNESDDEKINFKSLIVNDKESQRNWCETALFVISKSLSRSSAENEELAYIPGYWLVKTLKIPNFQEITGENRICINRYYYRFKSDLQPIYGFLLACHDLTNITKGWEVKKITRQGGIISLEVEAKLLANDEGVEGLKVLQGSIEKLKKDRHPFHRIGATILLAQVFINAGLGLRTTIDTSNSCLLLSTEIELIKFN